MNAFEYKVDGTSVRLVERRHEYRGFTVVDGGKHPSTSPRLADGRAASKRSVVYKRAHASSILASVAIVCLLVVCGLLVMILSTQMRDAAYEQSLASIEHYEQVVVKPGQTLSGIAEEHPVDGLSTSQVVDLLMARNGLESGLVQAGAALDVPLTN